MQTEQRTEQEDERIAHEIFLAAGGSERHLAEVEESKAGFKRQKLEGIFAKQNLPGAKQEKLNYSPEEKNDEILAQQIYDVCAGSAS